MLALWSTTDSPLRSLQLFADIPPGPYNTSLVPEPEILAGADISKLDLFSEFLAGAIK
jgi:hypothetical protein